MRPESESRLLTAFMKVLAGQRCATTLDLSEWDGVIRLARQSRLLGVLAHRLRGAPIVWGQLDERIVGHLQSAMNYGAYRVHLVSVELDALERALPANLEVVLLKGAAYIAQNMPNARGRMPNDVDIMVRRADLDATEAALLGAGWAFEKHDAYDERYYRDWSHELPPMRFPGHGLEVDLHHAIAPVTSRVRTNTDLLFSATQMCPSSRYAVLHPLDQIIHAVVHLFQDSDMIGRFRDLVDIDGLIRFHLVDETGWTALLERARVHGADELLWYALHYCSKWLATPLPNGLTLEGPHYLRQRAMGWIFPQICTPRLDATSKPLEFRAASALGIVRYHWLRMPPALLFRHSVAKAWRALTVKRGSTSSVAERQG